MAEKPGLDEEVERTLRQLVRQLNEARRAGLMIQWEIGSAADGTVVIKRFDVYERRRGLEPEERH